VSARDELAQRAFQALGNQTGVSAAKHEDLLEEGVREVVLQLSPLSMTTDIDAAIDAACTNGPTFPFC
jgi:hypothetical protein